MTDRARVVDRVLALGERFLELCERAVDAHERIAAAAERQAGTARASKRKPLPPVPVDPLTARRAREMARKSGFVVDGE